MFSDNVTNAWWFISLYLFLLIALTLVLAISCVSPKVYKELEDKYANLKKEHRNLTDAHDELMQAQNTNDSIGWLIYTFSNF